MEEAEYDLIVAGGGPAGSACAITAARAGARVLLLEKDHFPRHKVCGEFVSPESSQLLEWLLGSRRFQTQPAIDCARIFIGKTQASLPISSLARSIPRFDLDAALFDAARESGVQAEENTVIRDVQQSTTFTVKSGEKSFAGGAVVNATGRWSQLTQPYQGKASDKWIGIKGHFHEANPSPCVDLYFFKGGYCGVQPASANTVNACAMVSAEAARSFEDVFSQHHELWRRSRSWEALFPAITTAGLYFGQPQTQSNGMLLAGDAAAFIDPFAGDGISLALQSGALAAESLASFFEGRCSLEQVRQNYHTTYMKRFGPAFHNAARVRMLLSAPSPIRSILARLAAIKPFARALVLLCYKKGAPQKGQPESCRSRSRAIVCRSVAIDQGLCRSTRTGRTPRAEVAWHFGEG